MAQEREKRAKLEALYRIAKALLPKLAISQQNLLYYDVLSQMDIPWLRRPIETQLNALATELRAQWLAFNRELRQSKLKHLDLRQPNQDADLA